MSRAIRHLTIRGRVQGVGYRAWVACTAASLGLEGWVRNCRDSSVEAVLAGTADVVEQMIEHCRRGPASAHVGSVHANEAGTDLLNLRPDGEKFAVLPTL